MHMFSFHTDDAHTDDAHTDDAHTDDAVHVRSAGTEPSSESHSESYLPRY